MIYIKFLSAIAIFILTSFFVAGCDKEMSKTVDEVTGVNAIEQKLAAEKELAIAAANRVFRQAAADGVDGTNGPCLADPLIKGWVLDVVHSPRQPEDDIKSNQCESYLKGNSKHIIEITVDGTILKVE